MSDRSRGAEGVAEAASRVRPATHADGPALARLFAQVPMEGSLVLSTRREPEFFALYDIQRGTAECLVFEHDGKLAGIATALVRSGWLDGKPRTVGYLGDLRMGAEGRRQRVLVRHFADVLRGIGQRHDCHLFLTGILASNAAAMRALVRRRSARQSQPRYWPFRHFDMVSIQFTRKRRAPPPPPTTIVRTARAADVPALRAFLDADHRARPFGYRFDDGELEHRLRAWPAFSLERTYIALDGERVVGCVSAWDAAAVKRYRVEAYRRGMRGTKLAFNLAARVFGWPRLPDPGSDFRYFYLCNPSVADDDPAILRALIDRIYADFHGRGYHFFSLGIYENDPLAAATRGLPVRRLPFELYVVTDSNAPEPRLAAGRPGFEMALA